MSVRDIYRDRASLGHIPILRGQTLIETPYRLEPDENTVGLWWFDERTGTILYDKTPTPHNGTIVNASWNTLGPWKSGLTFGGDKYVSVNKDAAAFGTGNFTIEVVASEPPLSADAWASSFLGSNVNNYWLVGIRGNKDATNKGVFWFETDINGSHYFGTPVETRYDNDTVYYFAATVNRNTPLTSLYVNGVSRASLAIDFGGASFNTPAYLSFGRNGNDAGTQMYGKLFFVRLSSRSRSSGEILVNAKLMGFA